MSGIVGSKLNIRGSGRIAKLGTDGQVLTSAGAGVSAVYEDAAGGGLSWQSVTTGSTLTAVAGNAYPINTTSNACEITLPTSPSVGDTIKFTDYARTWGTNAVTLDQGSVKFQSRASTGTNNRKPFYETNGQSVTLVYVDATQGWIPTVDDHVIYGSYATVIDILLVGGGGSGGSEYGGGGGAGGLVYKTSHSLISATRYDVVIGAGGAGQTSTNSAGNNGGDTTWTKFGEAIPHFTAKGGGAGGGEGGTGGQDGGSGGGAIYNSGSEYFGSATQGSQSGDSGTYGFGFNGGDGINAPNYNPGGGGGAGSVGADATTSASGNGGTGKDYSSVFANEGDSGWFASGGGGGYTSEGNSQAGSASDGGATAGGTPANGNSSAAAANTGGGSGGGASTAGTSGNGGSGVICFKILTSIYTNTTTGSPTTRTTGDYTIVEFTGDGSYTA